MTEAPNAYMPPVTLELDKAEDKTNALNVLGMGVISIQATNITGAWGSGEVTLQQSIDGIHFIGFDTPVTVSTADGIEQTTGANCAWVRAIVSAAGTPGHRVTVSICGRMP